MAYTYSFEKLEVWQDCRIMVVKVYQVTKKFPDDEKYGLSMQLRRAVISVSSNIAEGTARNTSKDRSHFYNLAYSSLMEILSQIIVSFNLNYISETELQNLRLDLEKISNKLNALRKTLN